jgi:hypothetical protein
MLFKKYHVWPILQGRKTLTHRLWDMKKAPIHRHAMVKPHRPYQAKTLLFGGTPFARIQVEEVTMTNLSRMTEADAQLEGGYTLEEYFRTLEIINKRSLDMDEWIFRVRFSLLNNFIIAPWEMRDYEALYWQHLAEIRQDLRRGA